MRHRKKINHLSRKTAHRKAMLSNMAASLILHKRINTTLAKAKALRIYVEPLITKSKEDTTHSRRMVFSYLQNKEAVTELFKDVSVKVADRPGGYTRIIKTGARLGDNAEMCMMELVDYNENLLKTSAPKTKTARRSRRKKSSDVSSSPAVEQKTTDTAIEEAPVVEEAKVEAPVIEEAEVVDEKVVETEAKADDAVVEDKAEDKPEDTTKDKPEDTTEDETKKEDK